VKAIGSFLLRRSVSANYRASTQVRYPGVPIDPRVHLQPEVARVPGGHVADHTGCVVRARGVDFKIVASFPDYDVQIRKFSKPAGDQKIVNESQL
jgi:hypothetical protein